MQKINTGEISDLPQSIVRTRKYLSVFHEEADHGGRAVFARTLASWVRILLEAWTSMCVYSVFVLFYV
jgi:hypothetical protein